LRAFAYARPETLDEAISLLDEYGSDARVLAGGTDLIIRLRDRTLTPTVVVDVKADSQLCAVDPARRWGFAHLRRHDHDGRFRRSVRARDLSCAGGRGVGHWLGPDP